MADPVHARQPARGRFSRAIAFRSWPDRLVAPWRWCCLVTCLWVWLSDGTAFPQTLHDTPGDVQSPTTPEIRPDSSGPRARDDKTDSLAPIVTPDYIIGPEDVLDIIVWHNQDVSRVVPVRPDGRVSLPLINDVVAVGKTPAQLTAEITARLSRFITNPSVAIVVKEVNSYTIFVLGEVAKPGKYPLKTRTNLLQAISIAGGFTQSAARNRVLIYRSGKNGKTNQRINVSYDEIVLHNDMNQNIELTPGDTIVVLSETMVVR